MYRTSPPAGAPPQESCYGHMILKILDVNLNVLDYIQSIWCCFHIWFLGNITLKLGISKRHVMDSIKPITLYGHARGPNPWKVAIIFEELDIQNEMRIIPLNELKQPAYKRICINGRTPAIEDPNTGITLWESGAIIEYLVETYDKGRKLGFEVGTPEYWHAKQWLYFQVSGQGPYFGQAVWFKMFHAEKVQSALDRYVNEIHRVSGVLNRALQGHDWLVGDKYSFADVSFLTWYEVVIARVIGDAFDISTEFPNLKAWLDRMTSRPAVASVLKAKAAKAAASK